MEHKSKRGFDHYTFKDLESDILDLDAKYFFKKEELESNLVLSFFKDVVDFIGPESLNIEVKPHYDFGDLTMNIMRTKAFKSLIEKYNYNYRQRTFDSYKDLEKLNKDYGATYWTIGLGNIYLLKDKIRTKEWHLIMNEAMKYMNSVNADSPSGDIVEMMIDNMEDDPEWYEERIENWKDSIALYKLFKESTLFKTDPKTRFQNKDARALYDALVHINNNMLCGLGLMNFTNLEDIIHSDNYDYLWPNKSSDFSYLSLFAYYLYDSDDSMEEHHRYYNDAVGNGDYVIYFSYRDHYYKDGVKHQCKPDYEKVKAYRKLCKAFETVDDALNKL